MFSVQTVMIIKMYPQIMTCPELELISIRREPVHNAPLETGLLFTGSEDSRMEELLLTPRWKVTKDPRLSLLVTIKFSNAGILPSPNSIPEILPPLIAHQPTFMEILSPGHQLEESQSHSIPILILKSKFSNVEEPQNSFNNHHNQ